MSSTYRCKRCDYETINYNALKKHINIKKMCYKNVDVVHYSDDQILIQTLMPYNDDCHTIDENEIKLLEESSLLHKNKNKVLDLIDKINRHKTKTCYLCNTNFENIFELRKHLLLNCFYKELQKIKNELNDKSENQIPTQHTTILNNQNSNNVNNNVNNNSNNGNVNIYFQIQNQIKDPIPFDKDWDVSHISPGDRSKIIISNMMYSKLLDEILKNELNLNVIIDNESKSGMVYKNNNYVNMKQEDIIDKTMDKLNKHLIDFNLLAKDENAMKEVIDYTRRIINQIHINYGKNKDLQHDYCSQLTNVYQCKKEDAIKLLKKK